MPGLVGFTGAFSSVSETKRVLQEMQQLITHQDYYKLDDLFCDFRVCATRSHTNIIQNQPQPYQKSGLYVWLDGEFYNQTELCSQTSWELPSDPAILLSLFRQGNDFSSLKKIDGVYSAVIYDSTQQKIYLISDRYGLRPLCWTVCQGSLAWSSEVKAMLVLPSFEPKIDPLAVDQFFSIGQLLENRTWFDDVTLLSSGSILTWDLRESSYVIENYWSWSDIKALPGQVNETEAAEELGRLFMNAVKRRCHSNERIGLMLSGGLDSRAILAAIPEQQNHIHTITFGEAGCDDIRFAAMAAAIKSTNHHTYDLHIDNWLDLRPEGVWLTDGHLNLLHMHGLKPAIAARGLYDINLHSLAGDLIFGGSYLVPAFLNARPIDVVDKIYNKIRSNTCLFPQDSLFEYVRQVVSQYSFTDAFFLQNRVRRFTLNGPIMSEAVSFFDRKPTYDNDLLEFCYSLPDDLRYQSRLYNKMLLKFFPDYFEKIPWQKTGVPISWSDSAQKVFQLSRKVKRKFLRAMKPFGYNHNSKTSYTNYPLWIRQEPARTFFKETLISNSAAIYPNYISKEHVQGDWKDHLNGENHADSLCRYLTFEIWLQQVFNGNYRSADFETEQVFSSDDIDLVY
ncbi:MAG: hypothetical protein KDJ52_14305 [Anaerolineae bacterium]|nr:hypothetical protein [Anaerolineae bacterium]MCB0210506.1 hypothetical protein [Anaerolineae bacterium]